MEQPPFKVLCFGDVVGRPGREALQRILPALKARHNPELVIVNAENAAGGLGLDFECARELLDAGAHILTLGDHTYHKKEIRDFLEKHADVCIRPANYPPGAPGRGLVVKEVGGTKIGIFNLMGRVFMNGALDCPFRGADTLLEHELASCTIRILDFHAEATSEKVAMGRYLDGKVSLIFGTHTHVQTSDNQVLPGGTGYITDLGMCGSNEGVIGMDTDVALERFVKGLPKAYKIAAGNGRLRGVYAEIDRTSGKALSVQRIDEE